MVGSGTNGGELPRNIASLSYSATPHLRQKMHLAVRTNGLEQRIVDDGTVYGDGNTFA